MDIAGAFAEMQGPGLSQEELEAAMQRLYETGAPDRSIARILHVSGLAVRRWRKKEGLSSIPKVYRRKANGRNGAWEDVTPIRLAKTRPASEPAPK